MTRKLSSENVKFIDVYLKNSEIEFADIRVEMVDHVASEIEQRMFEGDKRDFYYVFKDYMVENKAILKKNNRKFIRVTDKNIGKKWLKNILSINGLLVFMLTFFSTKLVNTFYDSTETYKMVSRLPIYVFIGITVLYFTFIKRKRERYSAIERLGFFFLFIYYVTDIFMKIKSMKTEFINENNSMIIFVSSLIITLSITLLITAFQFKKEYNHKFSNIA